ncbi:General secretory system II protein E domain protein [Anaeromyxobacter dehalogenans 2CP-1]|uniref:General secretory system II protein E domain protein n=1 Tax=Anaeromyxobacter dehalogenans (strain ATCC BAA-258 / DSM 21875 / 2CP-1) TaxID=455488 RepID=B8JAJ3_ANAD2|nr:general secretion pathway protein GspE [Anaeromyxobacter dehalogenans]ACL67492.1 General secretory system II protein E domain protein [Anaeromyxobacter dehalogenans 2CP-1]
MDAIGKRRLGELLLEAGVIDATQLQSALGHQRQWGVRLGQALVDLKLAGEADIVQALSRKYGYEVAHLDALEPYALELALRLVPREFALRNNVFPLGADTGTLAVAMSDPTNLAVVDELRFRTGRKVKVCIGGDREIAAAVRDRYPHDHAIEAIALDLDADDPPGEAVLDPFGGGSKDALEAFFGSGAAAAAPRPAAPRAAPPPGAAPPTDAASAAAPRPAGAAVAAPPAPRPPGPAAAPAPGFGPAIPPQARPAPAPGSAQAIPPQARPAPAAPPRPGPPPGAAGRVPAGPTRPLPPPGALAPPGARPPGASAFRPPPPAPAGAVRPGHAPQPIPRPAGAPPAPPAARPAPAPAPAPAAPARAAPLPAAPSPSAPLPSAPLPSAPLPSAPSPAAPRALAAPLSPGLSLELEDHPGPEEVEAARAALLGAIPQEGLGTLTPVPMADPSPFTDGERAILSALERLAAGAPAEPEIVKPAQAMAALFRALLKRGLLTERDLLDELVRR